MLNLEVIRDGLSGYRNVELQHNNDLLSVKILTDSTGTEWGFELKITQDFINGVALPELKLLRPFRSIMPHVNWSGVVCISDGALVILPVAKERIIVQVIQDGIAVLENSREEEFWDELEGYWLDYVSYNHNKYKYSRLHFDPEAYENGLHKLRLYQGDKFLYFHDNHSLLDYDGFGSKPYHKKTVHRSLMVCTNKNVILPRYGQKYTVDKVVTVLESTLERKKDRREIRHLINKANNELYIILRTVRPSGGYNLIGITINSSKFNSFAKGFNCKRMDANYLNSRVGNEVSLENFSIGLLGCGSIGSHILLLLAQSGCKDFTIIDKDYFDSDNLYRHGLPSYYLNNPFVSKVEALKVYMKERFIGLKINKISKNIMDWAKVNIDVLRKMDCLIVAIGEPNIELWLNQFLRANDISINIINVWQEASGVGGHCISYSTSGLGGYCCLYEKNNNTLPFSVTSFISSNQVVTKTLGGCVSSFVPNGIVGVMKTATMAVDLAIYNLLNSQWKPSYKGWKNESPSEYKVTDFYNNFETKKRLVSEHLKQGCRVCSK